MHEVGLVMDMIDRVGGIIRRETGVEVVAIDVCIGEKSGVDCEAFEFAYMAAIVDTALAETRLRIRRTDGFDFQFESLEVKGV
jgi:Zn finger protein HypA/HybF involved in hydrogenase expression